MFAIHASTSAAKSLRHRERLRAAGLRPVQLWVPDTRAPGFAAQVRSQCLALKDGADEADAIGFAETAAAETEGWV